MRLNIKGIAYLSDSNLCFGQYGGAGDVGLANIRFLKEKFEDQCTIGNACLQYQYNGEYAVSGRWEDQVEPADLVIVGDERTGMQAWVREDHPETEEIMASLADYPCLSDDKVSEVEQEWEREAWDSYLKRDLISTLPEDLQDQAEETADAVLFECYRQAMDKTNTYTMPGFDGVFVDINRIKHAFYKATYEVAYNARIKQALREKGIDGPYPDVGAWTKTLEQMAKSEYEAHLGKIIRVRSIFGCNENGEIEEVQAAGRNGSIPVRVMPTACSDLSSWTEDHKGLRLQPEWLIALEDMDYLDDFKGLTLLHVRAASIDFDTGRLHAAPDWQMAEPRDRGIKPRQDRKARRGLNETSPEF